jgi:hypothetical protein
MNSSIHLPPGTIHVDYFLLISLIQIICRVNVRGLRLPDGSLTTEKQALFASKSSMPANKTNRITFSHNNVTSGESMNFPKGYGDFTMQSSDHMLFYFPSAILAHVSPFFKDIININANSFSTSSHDQPLLMEEDARAIFLLLCHIDPLMKTPAIDTSNAETLVKTAYKYRIASVIQWFQEDIFMVPQQAIKNTFYISNKITQGPIKSFAEQHPLLVLSLAEDLGLGDLSRQMLRLLLNGPAEALHSERAAISDPLGVHLFTMRQRRIDWHLQQFRTYATQFDSSERSRCPVCRAQFFQWSLYCTSAIHNTPIWESIENSKGVLQQACPICEDVPLLGDTMNFSSWKKRALSHEAKLPMLPK